MFRWIARLIAPPSDPQLRARSQSGRLPARVWMVWALLVTLASAEAASPAGRGIPFTRRYSLEDIGYGPRGARLDFDRFGRVAVIHDGVYAVLNDTVWKNIADSDPDRVRMTHVVSAPDGRMYYGARASWGRAETQADGLLHAVPLTPADPPEWIRSASFADLIATRDGVYFISPNGIAFHGYRKSETQLYEHSRISRAFRIGDTVYVSAFNHSLHVVDIARRELRPAPGTDLDNIVVELATTLDDGRALLSLLDGRLVVFDGRSLSPWEPQVAPWGPQIRDGFRGRVSVLHHLTDGRTAVGVTGKGLFLYSNDGELLLSLTTSEYHRITAMANREPGVLWIATEDGIEKILYSSALTLFGQQLGLTLGWPIIARWQDQLFVASDGKLYRALRGPPGAPTQFEAHPYQPENGAWALAAAGPRMLVGGTNHIYAVEADGQLRSVAELADIAHFVMIDANRCYAIGRSEIAFLEWRDGRWTEPVPRIKGVTYPSVVHRVENAVWIEMGGQVGRLWLRDGQLQLDIIPNASWTTKPWVNIGAAGGIVVLSADQEDRRFFDEHRGTWCDAPALKKLLNRSPYWIARLEEDDAGTLWATHDDGVIKFTPKDGDYEIDARSFDLINDRYPVLQVLPGNDVWIIASQSLYHVEQRWATTAQPPGKPILVSLVDARGDELLTGSSPTMPLVRLPFERNSLTLQFFSGSDAGRRAPSYEYKLTENDPWSAMAGSQVSLRGLREGRYDLLVRLSGKHLPAGGETALSFEISPPWYRTWPAYAGFGLLGSLALFGMVHWASYLERKRRLALEQIVRERTHQLEETMARLGEETRTTATLAERDRLANEIHDSVQQGLTGAILQLDTTLKLPVVGGDVRSRLNVVRNMVSYARQEVQHAVWDMESPLLEGTELGDALRNLTTFVDSGEIKIHVAVSGQPVALDRTVNHNLLRIAQEATTNAIRHAQPQRIEIQLDYAPDTIGLTIADDGIGFVPNDVMQGRAGHLGLRGIKNRVKKLRGRLNIESAPTQGTTIRIVVPRPVYDDSSQHPEGNHR